jgi:hypothetical protein
VSDSWRSTPFLVPKILVPLELSPRFPSNGARRILSIALQPIDEEPMETRPAPHPLTPATTFDGARTNLRRFVQIAAGASAQIVGFGWRGDPDAPTDYRSLLHAYARSQFTGAPLPVSDEHMERTIYVDDFGNLAFRFWHDITHLRLGHGFDLDGEFEVSRAHLDVLAAAGFPPGTLEHELLHADTLGQTLCGAATGRFPVDQICFARLSLGSTLALAIRSELHPLEN